MLGGLAGGALVYANYYLAIDAFEGGPGVRTLATAGAFATYAVRSHQKAILTAFINKMLASWTT